MNVEERKKKKLFNRKCIYEGKASVYIRNLHTQNAGMKSFNTKTFSIPIMTKIINEN